jgi:hypothetical protein
MSYKKINAALTCLLLLVATSANAGLITDTTNDSFIDETTGLEWMDFGINNEHTYNQVEEQLDTTYVGWELASQSQVLAMWSNAFAGLGTVTDNSLHMDSLRYLWFETSYATKSRFTSIFDVMGYNYGDARSGGWFEDDANGLSYVQFADASSDSRIFANAYGRGFSYAGHRTNTVSGNGTMLVKRSEVPEPSTFAIFALGMIGLASRRFKRH